MTNIAFHYHAGDPITFGVNVTDPATGLAADPTLLAFGYRVGLGAWTWQTYGQGPSTILRTAQGAYNVVIDSTAQPGTWSFLWAGDGLYQFGPTGGSLVVHGTQSAPVWP